MAENVIREEEV